MQAAAIRASLVLWLLACLACSVRAASPDLVGRVVADDGKPRAGARDSQAVTADGEGRFGFDCVPAETVDLSVRVPGYHVSETNESLDRLNNLSLKGKVDGDVTDLTVQLDPGPIKLPDHHVMTQAQRQQLSKDVKHALESRIAGVRTGS